MQQVDDPPSLPVGTEVSAKYKGAFCEAKVSKVVRNIKVKVAFKHGLGSGIVSDDAIKSGLLRVGGVVEVKHPDRKDTVEATVTKIQDCSQYTVVFDDGDITTLRRTALCLKSGRHFNESETLDQLPLTHPEHFGNPVVGGRRGRRRHMNDDSSDDEEESDTKEVVNEKEEHIGKVVCVDTESKKKDKEKWFPGLVVSPNAQATVRIRVKDEYLVRSFKDGRYYTVPKKEASEFTREAAAKQDGPAVQAALEYLDSDVLPAHWDRDALFDLSNSSSEEGAEMDSDSSDDEPREEKDRFVAQLYKYMDDRGTPLNKVPSIQSRDVDLYRLFRAVQKRGGYNRATTQNQWKSIAIRLGFTPVTVSVANLVKQAYKKFLQPYGEFHRKLGCSMLMTPRNSNRSKGRSLVRANSVASPKPVETSNKDSSATSISVLTKLASVSTQHPSTAVASTTVSAANVSLAVAASTIASVPSSASALQSATEESENTSESSIETSKTKRKSSTSNSKVKSLIEKYEEKVSSLIKDDGDVPLAKMKAAAAASSRAEEKDLTTPSTVIVVKDISAVQIASTVRETSPTGISPGPVKKEKYQKKQTPQSDEKRGKRKKDEISVEKVDAGDFIVEIGDKLKVYYHEKKVTYEAKVIEITLQRGIPMYLVHYTGWNNRYDEWVPRERIAENLTKGSKQKGGRPTISGHLQHEKPKENPPKPPTVAQLQAATTSINPSAATSIIISSTSTTAKTPTSTSSRRGRGRSDSLPPRSTTPSSVASNSSRTKSPAASSASLKRRPTRTSHPSSIHRRTSANVSDVSMPTETDTDSDDEPVRRPTRAAKDSPYKASGSSVAKIPVNHKTSASATNSHTDDDTDDDEDEDDVANTSSCRVMTAIGISTKGRDYDLNQIRSELKGFQKIKSPSPTGDDSTPPAKGSIKVKDEPTKTEPKEEPLKAATKEEVIKSSATDMSSESDSFADDDSQSSDKTTTLENMTKKFQQKINADKQRALVKAPASGKIITEKLTTLSTKTHIVEKIIKDSLAEKRQESLKAKPPTLLKEESKFIKIEMDLPSCSPVKSALQTEVSRPTLALPLKTEEKKPPTTTIMETKSSGIIAPARFGSGSIAGSKFTSVIVEKPLNVMHKKADISSMHIKKFESPKKQQLTEKVGKKVLEQPSALHKDAVIKVEPPAVCSPTSSSSSSSSSSSTSSTSSASSRSLPDMSKLDISGSSTSSSVNNNKETTKVSSVTILKSNSPDIYEFKDPEPFEYEMRKSTLTSHSTTSSMLSALSSSAASSSLTPSHFDSKRKQVIQKHITVAPIETPSTSSVTALVTRKKRGSPLKESIVEKSKQLKLEEKPPLVLEAKLTLRSSATSSTLSTSANPLAKSSPPTQNKTVPIHTATHTSSCSGASVKSGVTLTTQNTANLPVTPQKHEHFDASQKSPSFNLNMNALNEELAQTVQETTRALTDALHTISTQEFTPTKAVPPSSKLSVTKTNLFGSTHTVSPQLVTPPAATAPPSKPVIGSPFIETRKDLSNVFELSTTESETSGSTSGQKDNKFELENVKILLSHSVSAFDLEPAKFESKPTSIADKVLKAISQKKEVENKNKELKQVDAEKDATCAKSVSAPTSSSAYNSNSTHDTVTPVVYSNIMKATTTSVTTASLISTPLQVLTDLPTSSSSVISTTTSSKDTVLDKTNMSSVLPAAQLAKRPLLCSPDSKLGMLESITVKNNDLSETIQKLECALQKKTPVQSNASSPAGPSLSPVSNVVAAVLAPTPTSAFSDDSMDSTDSERRLVIEDVEEAPYIGETKTNPPTTVLVDSKSTSVQPPVTPIKVEAPLVSLIATPVTQQTAVIVATVPNLQSSTAIPVKMVTSGKPSTAPISTSSINTIQPKFVGKLHGNTSPIILTAKPSVAQMQQSSTPVKQLQQHSPHSVAGVCNVQTHLLPQNIQLAPTAVQSKTTEIIVSGSAAKLAEGQQISTGAPLKLIAAQALQRSPATVVPIVLPDIPVSVVVASSAVPSVVAAAQAAQAAQAAASQQTPPETQLGAKQSVGPIKCTLSTSSIAATTILSSTPYVTTSSFSANSASLKTFENAAAIRNIPLKPIAVVSPSPPLPQAAVLSTSSGGLTSSKITQPTTVVTPSAFFLDVRTADLRPDDGVKPILDIPTGDNGDEKSTIKTVDNNTNAAASRAATTSSSADTHSDSINLLLCEETIPGSPAPAFGKEEPSHSIQHHSTHSSDEKLSMEVAEMLSTDDMPTSSTKAKKTITTTAGVALSANPTPNSSPNDSASQDEMSSEDLKKNIDIENEVSPRKRRRTRKQSEIIAQINDQQTKRRRPLVCGKKNTAGSDSDDNSDTISQRSTTSARPNQHQHLQQQITTGSRSCPYNFLVQLDPAMNPDQRIALLLKQIQDLRKTYNMIKGDLASIDRRRKKLRRREREKKQHMQQQQVKMST